MHRLETIEAILKQQLSRPQTTPDHSDRDAMSIGTSSPPGPQKETESRHQAQPEHQLEHPQAGQQTGQQEHDQRLDEQQHMESQPMPRLHQQLPPSNLASLTERPDSLILEPTQSRTAGSTDQTLSPFSVPSHFQFYQRAPLGDASSDPIGDLELASFLLSSGPPLPTSSSTRPRHSDEYMMFTESQPLPSSRGQPVSEDVPVTIPTGHDTTTDSLFSLNPIKKLIGDYPDDFFYHFECSRTFTPVFDLQKDFAALIDGIKMDRTTMNSYISAFFNHSCQSFPILEDIPFLAFYERTMQGDLCPSSDVALCLVVLAMGKFVPSIGTSGEFPNLQDVPGIEYFSAAHQILTSQWMVEMDSPVSLPAAMILASLFLFHLNKPLPAWKMVYMASSKLQLAVTGSLPHPPCELGTRVTERLCWTCFLLECDVLAEFHLPRSGIEITIDRMHFPTLDNPNDRRGLLFLALCSVRRLLNRIHNAIYASSIIAAFGNYSASHTRATDMSATSPGASVVASMEGIVIELARQLDTWYFYLPESVKPDLSHNKPHDKSEAWVRLRYWSARHIISRPCLIYVTTVTDQENIPNYVHKYCKICVESCMNYLETASFVLSGRTQYTWMTTQACLSAVFILALASETPSIQHLVPDIKQFVQKVIVMVRPWASPDSSAGSILCILQTILYKKRFARAG
ncbi:uncharacterized protein PV07_12499 [Cladophialophora immunda]|uniref:Transcription factor domain-containing protein n=1 Tax=Cladophialophora immunda TaxID=569365 RepID=A0A0D2ABE9_9EURO|nr:uncharacterized protein PV07_12499 [Cladophialophora immunda]KIW22082.1 hypothetical protein PV07_12499 [Cladophialophora immunda]